MNQFLAKNNIRWAGPTAVKPVADRGSILVAWTVIDISPPLPASLPLVSSRNGNLFQDRNDPNLHWYLPDFNLADDVDGGFAFVASQSGQDLKGNPFNKARLTLRLHKSQPDDVAKFSGANPDAKLREITLGEVSPKVTTSYTDDTGQQQQKTIAATIEDVGNGDFMFTVDPILAEDVIVLYQDLTAFGQVVINLSGSYQAWSQPGALYLLARKQQLLESMNGPAAMSVRMLSAPTETPEVAPRAFAAQSFIRKDMPSEIRQRGGDTLVQTSQVWAEALPMGLKYAQDGRKNISGGTETQLS